MKKICLVLSVLIVLSNLVSAQMFIGAKAAGMGGAGTAVPNGLASIYYNPASIIEAGKAEVRLTAGVSTQNLDKVINAASAASDLANFLASNYSKELNFSGSLNGLVGVNLNKIGLSVLPYGSTSINKPANSLNGALAGTINYDGILTLGTSYKVPFLPAALDAGINLKLLNQAAGSLATASGALTGTQNWSSGNGFGLDLGLLTTLSIPMVTDLKVGFAARDLLSAVNYTDNSQALTFNPDGSITKGAIVSTSGRRSAPQSSYVLGASASLPMAGIQVAGDLETIGAYTNTYLGFEYPVLLNVLVLRAGVANGAGMSNTTIGAKIGLPFITLDAAYVNDNMLSSNSMLTLDFGIGI